MRTFPAMARAVDSVAVVVAGTGVRKAPPLLHVAGLPGGSLDAERTGVERALRTVSASAGISFPPATPPRRASNLTTDAVRLPNSLSTSTRSRMFSC